MTIGVVCPVCGHSFRVFDSMAGTPTNCPRCGELLKVPNPSDPELMANPLPPPPPASPWAEAVAMPVPKAVAPVTASPHATAWPGGLSSATLAAWGVTLIFAFALGASVVRPATSATKGVKTGEIVEEFIADTRDSPWWEDGKPSERYVFQTRGNGKRFFTATFEERRRGIYQPTITIHSSIDAMGKRHGETRFVDANGDHFAWYIHGVISSLDGFRQHEASESSSNP